MIEGARVAVSVRGHEYESWSEGARRGGVGGRGRCVVVVADGAEEKMYGSTGMDERKYDLRGREEAVAGKKEEEKDEEEEEEEEGE